MESGERFLKLLVVDMDLSSKEFTPEMVKGIYDELLERST